jgi:protein TonB
VAQAATIERDFSREASAVAPRADSSATFAPSLDARAERASTPVQAPGAARVPFAALAVSLAAHGALIAALTLFAASPRPLGGAVEIPVEIVIEAVAPSPTAAEPPAPAPPPAATADPSPPASTPAPPPEATSALAAPAAESPAPVGPSPLSDAEEALPPLAAAPPPAPPPPAATPTSAPVEAAPPPPRAQPPRPLETAPPQPPRPKTALARASPGKTASAAPKAEIDAYRASLYARISGAVRYPEAARERGAAGVAVVDFSFDATGRVTSASLAQSSGDAALDAEAVAGVRRASPLPPPPEGAPRAYAIPLRYRLR